MSAAGRDGRTGKDSRTWLRWLGRGMLVILLGVAIWYGQNRPDIELPQTVTVYGFTIMEEVLQDAVLPGFQKQWQARSGERVEFITTFAGSGAITHEIINRFPVELALLSSEIDASRLSNRGIVPGRTWRHLPRQGVVTRSPMVILVRAGNPRGITSFEDLLQEGVGIVHCDPMTSGAGEWSLLSFYAAVRRRPDGRQQALARLEEIRDHIVVTEPSARAALIAFTESGKGDAFITYEREWLGLDPERRSSLQVVYPATTVNSEHLVIRIDKNIDPDKRELIDALVAYLWSAEAQAMFEAYGFMRSDPDAPPSDQFVDVLTLDDLGGPDEAKQSILAPWLRRPLGAATNPD